MDEKLYNLMNWREIEGIIYSDTDKPHELLGQHIVKEGVLIQAFIPDANKVQVKNMATGRMKEMQLVDEDGYYAVLMTGKKKLDYKLIVTYSDGTTKEFYDAYAYEPSIPEEALKKFNAGIKYNIYKYLGAHVETVDGVTGVRFAVWAPFATRVSVVGAFNNWDGRKHQMSNRFESGVFEIFIPEVKEGDFYKYEIRKRGEEPALKYDPYAFEVEKLPGKASVVSDVTAYKWTDEKWLTKRSKTNANEVPFNVYEVYTDNLQKEQADKIVKYVKDMGYTHVKLIGIIDNVKAPRAYYAPNPFIASPVELMDFVNKLHKENIGVMIDVPMHHFSSEEEGMAVYDGTCLYEHDDMKKGYSPKYNTKLYNYGRPEVSNFLISSALFWTLVYHMDGIVIPKAAAVLYLDYDKKIGEWTPNIYGGNENLEGIELFKHLNSVYKKLSEGAVIIAEDNSGYQNMTGSEVTTECLGFNFKYNEGWRDDLLDYVKYDPYVRSNYYHNLTLNNVYTFNDGFVLPLSMDLSNEGQPSLMGRMVGISEEKKFANLKLVLGYQMTYPGKKMLYMENDIATYETGKSFDTSILSEERNKGVNECMKALNTIYTSEPALHELDSSTDGFEWINNISANECIISYARKGSKPEDMLVVICNFEDVERDEYKIGVPKAGKYKEIFNSDNAKFGGNGYINPRLKQSKTDECDGRAESVRIKVPALGVVILKYSRTDEKLTNNKTAKAAKKATTAKVVEPKKTVTKKAEPKKTTTAKKKEVKATMKEKEAK